MKTLTIALAMLAVFCGSLLALHLYLLDGLDGWFFSLAGEDTVYASGYSDSSFRRVRRGMSEIELLELLGQPLGEVWVYGGQLSEHNLVSFVGDVVDHVRAEGPEGWGRLAVGMRKQEVIQGNGAPHEKVFVYSRSRGDQSYRVRTVTLTRGGVTKATHYFYAD